VVSGELSLMYVYWQLTYFAKPRWCSKRTTRETEKKKVEMMSKALRGFLKKGLWAGKVSWMCLLVHSHASLMLSQQSAECFRKVQLYI
jgi:hypothetical protein